jgi:hypothetical protein
MPRSQNTQADVDTPTEEVVAPEETVESGEKATAPKAKKEPARGDLPEGYVTPVGFAKVLSEKGLQANREGVVQTEVKPQMVYSYIKNAPKDDKFPLEQVKDSLGHERDAVLTEKGIEWWERKNARVAARTTNAKEKADKKAAAAAKRAEEKTTEAEGESTETSPATEAE